MPNGRTTFPNSVYMIVGQVPNDHLLSLVVTMPHYRWTPIEPLTESERSIDLAEIGHLCDSWRAQQDRLRKSRPGSLQRFRNELIRRLSVETGILERLYDLDRGTTEALIEKGFHEDLVSRSSTGLEPSHLIDILRDQESAIKLVMDCVAGNRDLTEGFIHQLHATLTRHQPTTAATDQLGKRLQIPLLQGRYKAQPNNPKRPDDSIHEYAPPVQVASQMGQLLQWFRDYQNDDPILTASWLHHRFTQIHPYQDGNGRVARALTTLVFARAELLPLVLDRDLRPEYIEALETADRGDLSKLAMLFAKHERTAILQALSIDTDEEIEQIRSLSSAVVESLKAKLERRKEHKEDQLRKVNELAVRLRSQSNKLARAALGELQRVLSASDIIRIDEGGPDHDNQYWYKSDVIQSAKTSDRNKFINFDEDHYFLKASIRHDRERLVFVISFHHVGRELSGIMEATAFAKLESYEQTEDIEKSTVDFACALEPFVITWQSDEAAIAPSYAKWLDAALATAFKDYTDRL